jgi:hypothetical protein
MKRQKTQTTAIAEPTPRLDPRRRGFYLGDTLHEGFADRPGLPARSRTLIARWAERFAPERLEEIQRELLAAAPEPSVSLAQRELARNQRELRSPYLSVLFDSLTLAQQHAVQDPRGTGVTDVGYPLSAPQLARLAEASERQVRSWADEGLLPVYRESGERRFYSAAAIRAFALARAPGHSKAIASAAARGEVGEHFQLLAATLAQAATRMPLDLRERLIALAEDLSSSSRLMADISEDSELYELWQDGAVERYDDEIAVAVGTEPPYAVPPPAPPEPLKVLVRAKNGKVPDLLVKSRDHQVVVELKGFGGPGERRTIEVSEADEILSTRYGGEGVTAGSVVVTAPRGKGAWVNRISGQKRALSVHATKHEAEQSGRKAAREHRGKHVIYMLDGSISHSHDYD